MTAILSSEFVTVSEGERACPQEQTDKEKKQEAFGGQVFAAKGHMFEPLWL